MTSAKPSTMSSVLLSDSNDNISRNMSVPRVNGRFFKYKPDTEASGSINAKREAYKARKYLRNNGLFDRFISLFFRQGEEKDWIPTSERSGPLVKLAEIIFKKSFLLTRRARSDKVKLCFFGGDRSKMEPITKLIVTRDARLTKVVKSRVTIFSERRLPLVENHTKEMRPVSDWLVELERFGAFKCKSAEEAFSACLKVSKSYLKVDGKRAYHGYPKKKHHDETCVEERESLASCQKVASIPALTSPSHLSSPSNGEGSSNSLMDNADGTNHPDQILIGSQEESSVIVSEDSLMESFFGIADDDCMYALFHVIFDDDLPHKLEVASGLFLINRKSEDSRLLVFLHEIRTYLHNKRTPNRMDPETHRQREEKFQHVASLLTEVRELKELQTYKEMRNNIRYMF